jgi:hypothetical protein
MMKVAVRVGAAGLLISACASRDLEPQPIDGGGHESLPAGYLPLSIEALQPRPMLRAPSHFEARRSGKSSLAERVIRHEVKP